METWDHAKGVDPSSLENMGTLERLVDPIDTPMRSHDDRHERVHKARGACTSQGVHAGPRDEWLMGTRAWMGVDGPRKGRDESIECGPHNGCNELVECGFAKGHNTLKRHDVSHK